MIKVDVIFIKHLKKTAIISFWKLIVFRWTLIKVFFLILTHLLFFQPSLLACTVFHQNTSSLQPCFRFSHEKIFICSLFSTSLSFCWLTYTPFSLVVFLLGPFSNPHEHKHLLHFEAPRQKETCLMSRNYSFTDDSIPHTGLADIDGWTEESHHKSRTRSWSSL